MRLPDEREVHLLERTAVATATLSEAEIGALKACDDDVEVVPNQRRFLPRPIATNESAAVGLGVPATDVPTNHLVAYLHGAIDAHESMLRFLGHDVRALPRGVFARATGILGSRGAFSWPLRAIGVDRSVLTGAGVTVAVLDTGIDLQHPDLAHHFVGTAGTASFVPHVTSVQDGNGHGTHCAGVIAGAIAPKLGPRYAVAPDVTLLAGKVLDDSGSGYDDQIVQGIEWAAQMGATIISMSLGAPRDPNAPHSALYERIGSSLLEAGVLLVAAAGNESHRPQVAPVGNPAACPSFMAIAAVDQSNAVGWFSCGQVDPIGAVDLAAPGVAIHSAWPAASYRLESGTSMATPHVAGAAALWMQKTQLKGKALWQHLLASAHRVGSPRDVGAGLVQVP